MTTLYRCDECRLVSVYDTCRNNPSKNPAHRMKPLSTADANNYVRLGHDGLGNDVWHELPEPHVAPRFGRALHQQHRHEVAVDRPAWIAADGTRTLTVADLKDIASRAAACLQESEGSDEHADLIFELFDVVALCEDVAMTDGQLVLPLRRQS